MIRFTNSLTVYSSLRGDTSANLRTDFDTNLLSVGWTLDRNITNGKIYNLGSSQDLFCKCRIQDTGRALFLGPNVIDVQFMNVNETLLGFIHDLPYGSTKISTDGYTLQAGRCQMFVKLLGQSSASFDGTRVYNVAGGIPALPDSSLVGCAIPGVEAVNELWWSGGGCETNRGNQSNFRTSRYCYAAYSTCRNGVLFVSPGSSSAHGSVDSYEFSPLQLLSETPTWNTDFWFYTPPRTVKYKSGDPLNLDALLVFRFGMFGQLWDAFCKSRDTALDEEITTTEVDPSGNNFTATWESYNYDLPDENKGGGGTWYNTLYLLKGLNPNPFIDAGLVESNYAY